MSSVPCPTATLRLVSPEEAVAAASHVSPLAPDAIQHAESVLRDVEREGDAALRRWACTLGDIDSEAQRLVIPRGELLSAREQLETSTRGLLERTAERVATFARAQRNALGDLSLRIGEGCEAGHSFVPVQTAGCYAPGGRTPLLSSAIMTVITARAAGVDRVVLASPRPGLLMQATAAIAGADALVGLGGAPAIISLARGVGELQRCDVVVGPGNRFVTAAKHCISASTGIDMLAGPSELLVAADDSADPALVAADLLAQAEHDPDARPLLLTTDAALPTRVNVELSRQMESLTTASIAITACNNGFACVVSSRDELLRLVDLLAPEHLELHMKHANEFATCVRNAGAIFIGSGSAESFGDYGAGPNHVLPTGGTARFRAGLSVLNFLRARTWLALSHQSPGLAADVEQLARLESLPGHERAVAMRR